MKQAPVFALAIFVVALATFGQNGVPTIKTEVKSAFVWGEDSPTGAVSSTIQDPLTGNAIHKLSYAGIEVSSQLGFERIGSEEIGTFLSYTTTIVNSTNLQLSVRYGGTSVDGHPASPLRIVLPDKRLTNRERKSKPDMVELRRMRCFTNGFLSANNFFSANASSQVVNVAPGTVATVSFVIRDPRVYHSVLCSVEGCYPTGMVRYYLTVNGQDYVFVWPGRSAIYCGN